MRCVTLDNETTTGLHSREQVHTLVAMVCCCNRYCHCDWHGSDSPMEVGARARVCVRVCVCVQTRLSMSSVLRLLSDATRDLSRNPTLPNITKHCPFVL
jgi:hypothetical protein